MPKVKRAKRPPRTLKEKKWVKRTLETGNGTLAAMEIYNVNGRNSAQSISTQNYSTLSMEDEFEKAGLTNNAIAANTTRIALFAKKRDQYSGEIDEDNAMQLKGMEFAAKLSGKLKDDDKQTNTYFQYINNQKNEYGV